MVSASPLECVLLVFIPRGIFQGFAGSTPALTTNLIEEFLRECTRKFNIQF
jgi:hypothetical protein